MTETPVPRTGPSHRHPESIMPLNRRNFLGAAALGAGSLMLGSAQAAPAPALPKFTPPTAKKPMALCFNENPLGLTPAARDAAIAALPTPTATRSSQLKGSARPAPTSWAASPRT